MRQRRDHGSVDAHFLVPSIRGAVEGVYRFLSMAKQSQPVVALTMNGNALR